MRARQPRRAAAPRGREASGRCARGKGLTASRTGLARNDTPNTDGMTVSARRRPQGGLSEMNDVRNDMRDPACLEHADAVDLDRYLRFLRLFAPLPPEADDGRSEGPPTSGSEATGEAADPPA